MVYDNFISWNLETCVEINAHNMVRIIRRLRCINRPDLFKPSLMSSQPCEETFRTMRSMGSVNYTKINFTLLELFHLIGRVELLNDIIYSKLADSEVSFPRNKEFKLSEGHFQLPSDEEMKSTMRNARENAISDALRLSMSVETYEICAPQIKPVKTPKNPQQNFGDNYDEDINESDEEPCTKFSPYVTVMDSNGKEKDIRKSTLIWMSLSKKKRLSSDRLQRVKGEVERKTCDRSLQFKKLPQPKDVNENDQIQIGDWCIFSNEDQNLCSTKYLLGSVHDFQYIKGKNLNERRYTWDFAFVKPNPKNNNNRGINVLGLWYAFDLKGNIYQLDINSFYLNIECYIVTLSNPIFDKENGRMCFEKTFLENVQEDLQRLECKRQKM